MFIYIAVKICVVILYTFLVKFIPLNAQVYTCYICVQFACRIIPPAYNASLT